MRALALSLLLALPQGASALGADDPEAMLRELRAMGYDALMSRDEMGNAVLDPQTGAFPWLIFLGGCENGPCRDLMFSAAVNFEHGWTAADANHYNDEFRFGRLFIDDFGAIMLQHDVIEARDMAPDVFRALVERFDGEVYGLFVSMEGL